MAADTCPTKRRYSRAAAIRAASRLSARAYGGKLTAYACGRCGGWHIGHREVDRTTARGRLRRRVAA